MTAWELDASRFVEEVFLPVGDGWPPERNLFRLFQLPLDVSDEETVTRAVEGVARHLTRSSLAGVHATTAKSLRFRVEPMSATMLDPGSRAHHRAQVRAERADFAQRVRETLRGRGVLRPAELTVLVERERSRFLPREIEDALAEAGIPIRDPAPLDPGARPQRWRDLRLALDALGTGGLAGYLARRGLGPASTAAEISRVRAELDQGIRGDTLTAEEQVLGAVKRMIDDLTLEAALRAELLDELSAAGRQGADAIRSLVARPDVSSRAGVLGFPAGDELVYAIMCLVDPVGGAETGWRAEFRRLMADRDLRAALDLIAGRTDIDPELAGQRGRLVAEVEEIDRQLDRAARLEDTDPETACALYLAVLRRSRESSAETGVSRCLPPSPPAVRARIDGTGVRLNWDAAPVRAGTPGYRVTRSVAAGPQTVGTTTGCELVDPDPPAGEEIVYEVRTEREGVLSAVAAISRSVIALHPVCDLSAEPGDGRTRLTWQLPPGATAARVRREGAPVPGGSTSAVEVGLPNGEPLTWTVEAGYEMPGGRWLWADPVSARARPQAPPRPVTDLRIDDGPEAGSARASWTEPGSGEVVLRLTRRHPPGPGTLLVGGVEPGDPVRMLDAGPGAARIVLPADGCRRWVLPLTRDGDLTVAGTAVEQDRRLPAVTDLDAVRQGTRIRVSWRWPGRAGEALVLQRPDRPPDGADDLAAQSVRVSRAVYDREGCHLPAGAGDRWIGVCLTAFDNGETAYGPVVAITLGVPPTVHYAVHRSRRGHRKLVLRGVPPLVEFELRARVSVPPLSPAQGTRLLSLGPVEPGQDELSEEFVLPDGRPLHLRVFPTDPLDLVDLVPDDPDQLRVAPGWWR